MQVNGQNIYGACPAAVSTGNTSTAALAGGAQFTGQWEDVLRFSEITIMIATDQASATNGLSMQFSSDGKNIDREKKVSVSSTGSAHTLVVISRYFRITYLNGATPQGHFRLHVIHHATKNKELTSTLNQTITNDIDVQNVRAVLAAELPDGTYGNVGSDVNGRLKVSDGNETLFGDRVIAAHDVIVQNYAPYGIISEQLYTQFTASGGTLTSNTDGVEVDFNITTTVGSYAILRSKRPVKYRPGFSNMIKTSMRFNAGVTNSLQFCGVGSAVSDLYFAYTGDTFGVRRSTGGLLEVRTLTITAAATGAETGTLILNGVTYNPTLTNAGGALSFTAHEIDTLTYAGWNVEHINDAIIFSAASVGARGGAYSFSSTGAATGTFSQQTVGADLTTTVVAQSAWNGDSSMIADLDPTKNNLYQIEYSWFGSSNIYFSVYNPSAGRFETVHTMSFSNVDTAPSLTAPNMFIQQGVASLGSTTAMTATSTCSTASTLGQIKILGPEHSADNERTLASNVEANLIVLKNRDTVNGFPNQSDVIIRRITLSSDGNRAVKVKIIKNPTTLSADTTADYDSLQYVDAADSLLLYDVTSLTYTGGQLLNTFYVPKNGGLDLSLGIQLYQNEILLLTAESTAANTVNVAVSVIDDL